VPGETIFINADIVNNSQTDIVRTRAALKQVGSITATHYELHGGGIKQ